MGTLRYTRWVVLVVALAASAQAVPGTTVLYDRPTSANDPFVIDLVADSSRIDLLDGSVFYHGSFDSPDNDWSTIWDVEVSGLGNVASDVASPSLFIFATLRLTSLVDFADDFVIEVSLPGKVLGPTTITGSVSGSVADTSGDGNGATLSRNLAGDPFYTAKIDGLAVRTLLDAPFTFFGDPNQTNPWDGGDYDGEGPHPAVTLSISIAHNFRLTAHDSVVATSTLLVVPEPATLALLLFGVPAIVRRRRR